MNSDSADAISIRVTHVIRSEYDSWSYVNP